MLHGAPVELIDLPIELVERIMRSLDDISICDLALAHPRFEIACQRFISFERVSSHYVNGRFAHLVSTNASRVRSLDLSDCWSTSESMRDLIRRCSQLSELSVVNSALTVQHLLESVDDLKFLKKICATITDADEETRVGLYPSIEIIYFEFGPKLADACFVRKFLTACPNVKDLCLNALGNGGCPVSFEEFPSFKTNEALTKVDNLVIFGSKGTDWSCYAVSCLIFGPIAPLYSLLLDLSSMSSVFYCDRDPRTRDTQEIQQPRPMLCDMYKESHQIYYPGGKSDGFMRFNDGGRTIGVRVKVFSDRVIPMMPALDGLECVQELDLSACHLPHTSRIWNSFVKLSPKVEALALPTCCLFGPEESSKVDRDILKALSRLQLRELHVETPEDDCDRCSEELDGALMMSLGSFKRLEEFRLHRARVSKDFLGRLRRPLPMRTVKLNVDTLGDDGDLSHFLRLCEKLENLKLEALDLPLSSELFWDALAEANLDQLCLATSSIALIDQAEMRLGLSRAFRKLRIFHLHARDAPSSEVEACITEEARMANWVRIQRPLNFVVNQQSIARGQDSCGPKLVGRGVCCMESFIAVPKPLGWGVDS